LGTLPKLLKKFNLVDSQKNGYSKKPKFNKFLRKFLKAHPDFFSGGAADGGQDD